MLESRFRTYDGYDLRALERELGPLSDAEKAKLANGIRGGAKGWAETLITSEIDSTALTASTTPTSILPPAAVYTMPPGFLKVGAVLRIKATGRVSNIVTTPGTLLLDVRVGASTVILPGVAMQLNAVAKTNVSWWLDIVMTCRAIGNGTLGSIMGNGTWCSESVVGSPVPATGGAGTLWLQPVTPVVGTGFDTTVSQTINLFGTWSLNNANSILTHQYCLTHETAQ